MLLEAQPSIIEVLAEIRSKVLVLVLVLVCFADVFFLLNIKKKYCKALFPQLNDYLNHRCSRLNDFFFNSKNMKAVRKLKQDISVFPSLQIRMVSNPIEKRLAKRKNV